MFQISYSSILFLLPVNYYLNVWEEKLFNHFKTAPFYFYGKSLYLRRILGIRISSREKATAFGAMGAGQALS